MPFLRAAKSRRTAPQNIKFCNGFSCVCGFRGIPGSPPESIETRQHKFSHGFYGVFVCSSFARRSREGPRLKIQSFVMGFLVFAGWERFRVPLRNLSKPANTSFPIGFYMVFVCSSFARTSREGPRLKIPSFVMGFLVFAGWERFRVPLRNPSQPANTSFPIGFYRVFVCSSFARRSREGARLKIPSFVMGFLVFAGAMKNVLPAPEGYFSERPSGKR